LDLPADGYALPPVLAGLLSQNTWADGARYLRDNAAALLQPPVREALGELSERERELSDEEQDTTIGAYEVILQLAAAADGATDSDGSRQQPTDPAIWTEVQPEDGATRPPPVGFAFGYLVPQPTRQDRQPWDDRLLWLIYRGQLFEAQALTLAKAVHDVVERSVHDVAERSVDAGRVEKFDYGPANATVFAAISSVLSIDRATAQDLLPKAGDQRQSDNPFGEALRQLQQCRLLPLDKLAWVTRIGRLNTQLEVDNRHEHAELMRLLTHQLVTC
jgi:hypothetical protein